MNTTLLLLGIGMQELIVIVLILLLFFGGRKIPELMKLEEDLKADTKKDENTQPNTDKDK